METNSVSTQSVGLKYGIIVGLGAVAYTAVLYTTNSHTNQGLGWLGYVIFIAGVIFAFREFKTSSDGYMSLKQGIGVGFWITMLYSLFSSVFGYVYMKFIDPSVLDVVKEKMVEEWEKQGLSDEQIEQASSMASMFTSPEVITITGLIGGLIIGLIVAIIIAAVMKKDPEAEF
jgi:hypothetical protein